MSKKMNVLQLDQYEADAVSETREFVGLEASEKLENQFNKRRVARALESCESFSEARPWLVALAQLLEK